MLEARVILALLTKVGALATCALPPPMFNKVPPGGWRLAPCRAAHALFHLSMLLSHQGHAEASVERRGLPPGLRFSCALSCPVLSCPPTESAHTPGRGKPSTARPGQAQNAPKAPAAPPRPAPSPQRFTFTTAYTNAGAVSSTVIPLAPENGMHMLVRTADKDRA